MKNFSKEQQLIIRLANSLSQMIDAAESDAVHQDIGEFEETNNFLNPHRSTLNEAKYFINNQKELPAKEEGKVYITDANHVFGIAKMLAYDEIKELLEESTKEYKVTGLKLALTIVDSFTSDFKSSMILKNIKHAVAHGLNINDGALVLKTDDNGNIVMMINKE